MRFRARHLVPLAVTAAVTVAAAGCSGGTETASGKSDTTLNIATMTLPQSLDPAVATGSALPFFQAVYDTLIKRAPDGTLRPMLATAWSYDKARTTLSLTLRKGVTFHDGTPFNAKAVRANLRRFAKGGGADAGDVAGIKRVEVVDATHVKLHLAEPDPGLLFDLSDSAGLMAGPKAFKDHKRLTIRPDGTGPYVLDTKRTVIGTKWVYTRARHYWGKRPPYATITMSYFDNENAIVNGLKTGQLDTAVIQDADQQASVKADPKLTTQPVNFDFKGLLLFDRSGVRVPALAKTKVRRALNYAIDKPTMLKKIRQGRGEVTAQIFGKDTPGYVKSLDAAYPYDPAKARALLKQAGYAGGLTITLPRIKAIVPDALAASMKSDLSAVGITLTWDPMDQGTALKKIFKDKAYPGMVMNLGQSTNAWVAVTTAVLPGTFDPFGYTDATVKRLAAKIQREPAAKAGDDLRALNRHLVDDAWFVPFYRLTYSLVTDAGVHASPQAGMAVPSIYGYTPAD